MNELAAEMDNLILRILLSSEHGQEWLVRAAEAQELEDRLLDLRKRGLSDVLSRQLWDCGSLDLVAEVERATPEQIAALNDAEWSE